MITNCNTLIIFCKRNRPSRSLYRSFVNLASHYYALFWNLNYNITKKLIRSRNLLYLSFCSSLVKFNSSFLFHLIMFPTAFCNTNCNRPWTCNWNLFCSIICNTLSSSNVTLPHFLASGNTNCNSYLLFLRFYNSLTNSYRNLMHFPAFCSTNCNITSKYFPTNLCQLRSAFFLVTPSCHTLFYSPFSLSQSFTKVFESFLHFCASQTFANISQRDTVIIIILYSLTFIIYAKRVERIRKKKKQLKKSEACGKFLIFYALFVDDLWASPLHINNN